MCILGHRSIDYYSINLYVTYHTYTPQCLQSDSHSQPETQAAVTKAKTPRAAGTQSPVVFYPGLEIPAPVYLA